MLAIKLQRVGKKHQPSYRVVVAPKRSKMAAPPVEDLGFYNTATKQTKVNSERAQYWLGVGAQPTLTVHNLLVKEGVLQTEKRAVKIKRKEKSTEAEVVPAVTPAGEAQPAAPTKATPEAPAREATPAEPAPEVAVDTTKEPTA